ncbi:MAG: ATP-dependent RecD-like DNA helicase [Clostridia bacterium]
MKIVGKIKTIIFKNEVNHWTVLLVKVDSNFIKAVGETTDIEVGDELEFEGQNTVHKTYGTRFVFTTYKKVLPNTNVALAQYISDNVKGIGKKISKKIINSFPDNAVDVIRYTPDKLDGIKGLTPEKIQNLTQFFNTQWEKWNAINFLSQFNISVFVASKIYETLGACTIKNVKENPYSLLMYVKALDFQVVDKIGLNIGISLDSEARVDCGVIFALNHITDFGHTCIDKKALIDFSSELLAVGIECIENAIIRLKLEEKIYIQVIENEECIFRRGYYLAEDNIASNIVAHTRQVETNVNYDTYIEFVSKENSLVLSSEQKIAISTCLNSPISVITGGPGTGKTTIIKCIIDILENTQIKYVLCAPTGRAAKRITETTGKVAKTLHRLLEIVKVDDNDVETFFDIDVKTIDGDVVIVDESSMIDCMMLSNLFKAIKLETKVIFVGDIDQLPSVGPGNVLKDIIASGVVNVVCLKQIYRQSAQSDIIINAHKVNEGIYPEFKSKDTDMFFIKTESIEHTLNEISTLAKFRLQTFAKIDALKDLQILTPMKKTELGTIHLNHFLQEILNPKSHYKVQKDFGSKIFREGDKVMQIVNNYDKKFTIDGNHFDGVYNGDIGYIQYIDIVTETISVLFDDNRLIDYSFQEYEQLEHAYAVTIHKSQGSEFDYIILPLYSGYPKLFTRNLLYTAMTRAKKMLIIVGSKNVINNMVDNIESKNRKTGLKYKILEKV